MLGFKSPQVWRQRPFLTFGLPYIVGILTSTYVLLQVIKPTYEKKRLDLERTADLPVKRKPGNTVEEDLKNFQFQTKDNYEMVQIKPLE